MKHFHSGLSRAIFSIWVTIFFFLRCLWAFLCLLCPVGSWVMPVWLLLCCFLLRVWQHYLLLLCWTSALNADTGLRQRVHRTVLRFSSASAGLYTRSFHVWEPESSTERESEGSVWKGGTINRQSPRGFFEPVMWWWMAVHNHHHTIYYSAHLWMNFN